MGTRGRRSIILGNTSLVVFPKHTKILAWLVDDGSDCCNLGGYRSNIGWILDRPLARGLYLAGCTCGSARSHLSSAHCFAYLFGRWLVSGTAKPISILI